MNPQNYSLFFNNISKHENPLLESTWQNHKKFMPEVSRTGICPVLTCSRQSFLPVFFYSRTCYQQCHKAYTKVSVFFWFIQEKEVPLEAYAV